MKQLSEDVGIPHSIKEIGAKPEGFELMAENARSEERRVGKECRL